MDPVQALAILSLGAFVMVLITAIFYIFTVRPRLLETPAWGGADAPSRHDLTAQQLALDDLRTTLDHHTTLLETQIASREGDGDSSALQSILKTQNATVAQLTGLLETQGRQIAGLDTRLERQENLLTRTAQQVEAMAQVWHPMGADSDVANQIRVEAEKLVAISGQLEAWSTQSARHDTKLAEHTRLLAELDRELAAQAQATQRVETKVGEHTKMLLTAEQDRHKQITLLEHLKDQLGQAIPLLNRLLASPPRPEQDRLTDIKGIGPVYAGKLYEAGVQTFRQLAAMTPAEIYTLISEPTWRMRSIDAESWIEQATLLASQREKVEQLS